MSTSTKPALAPDKFLFVEPHAGYDPSEAASNTAAPSLSRIELAWERLLRRQIFLGIVSSSGGLSVAASAHASKKSISRFLRPGRADKTTTAPDGSDIRNGQSTLDDVVSGFNAFLSSSLPAFLVRDSDWVDREWTSGVATRVQSNGAEYTSWGAPRTWSDVSGDPQFRLPPAPFKTLGEAWLRADPSVSAVNVSLGIGADGNPIIERREYTVPRWPTSYPSADVEGVSTVVVDGQARTLEGMVAGYGVNDKFSLLYHDGRLRTRTGDWQHHNTLVAIPDRAPVQYPAIGETTGVARVWPPPTAEVNRCVDKGWVDDDLDLLPQRLREPAAACFVPPALVPCLRTKFPPANGWRCGLAAEHDGVPYGSASPAVSKMRILYRATADGMDRWLERLERTATEFNYLHCAFSAASSHRYERTNENYWEQDQTRPDPQSSWEEASSRARGTTLISAFDNAYVDLGTGSERLFVSGFGAVLRAPSASGEAKYQSRSRATTYTDTGVGEPSTSTRVTKEDELYKWSASLGFSEGVPVWQAPFSYSWSYTRQDSDHDSPTSTDGEASDTSREERRVIPPEFMPFVRWAEVFVLVHAEASSASSFAEELFNEHSSTEDGETTGTSSDMTTRSSTEAEEYRLLSLGTLDESGALPGFGLGTYLGLCPPGGVEAPAGRQSGYRTSYSRTDRLTTGTYESAEIVARPLASGSKRLRGCGQFILVVDWNFDADHDPFAASELNELWRELAEAGKARSSARREADEAAAELLAAQSALASARAHEEFLREELASLGNPDEEAAMLAELSRAVSDAETALSDAETSRSAAEAAAESARLALEAAESAEEPDEEEVEALRTAYHEALAGVGSAMVGEEAAKDGLDLARADLDRYRDLVDDAAGARADLEDEIEAAAAATASAEAAASEASSAKDEKDAAYEAAAAAYQAILARIR